ncbi:hypothetical protein A9179_18545 [Pseudomonas alcaligenes]|uniref:Tetratricopeptide repeat protein n=1 Tax=Aquipseudomonas alcaligenes TaxID=43263 RepID=A0ABR7S5G1_AQUAC|nr:hypothetical protein [Pseudomonas alcaligenes]MBC9252274.1 hypothetical protein [Pseudomonas alcaligenes]
MSSFKDHRRHLLALAVASLLPLATAQACGPDFPYRLLGDRSNALSQLPEGNFAVEIKRLGQDIDGLKPSTEATIAPYWDDSTQQYLDARVAAEKQQLSAAQFELISQLRSLSDAHQAEAAGAALPTELRLYSAGAVAFAQQDMALAAEYFQRVLALPAAERPLRSTWAAYSLGRALSSLAVSAADSELDEAALLQRQQDLLAQAHRAYQQARELSRNGFSDPLELGIASLGEEARLQLDNNDWPGAIRLYASQARLGSTTGYSSLRQLTWALSDKSDTELQQLLASQEVQQLLAAQLFSRIDDYDSHDKQSQRLLALLQAHSPLVPALADRLAALSYQQGDYAAAQRFVAQAGDSGLAWWLRAKLALQVGDKPAAVAAYAKAAKAFPADEDWGWRRNANWDYETLKPRCRIEGEMAILALERGDYLEAFDQLYRSGEIYWQDAAEVAERVLSSDELKGYIDAKVAAAPPPPAGQEQYYWERPLATSARELLGRRLLREGRYAEAVPYFASAELQDAARQYGAAREQAEDAWTASGRAEGYYRAAKLAREQGMELLGYELGPDEAWNAGSYGSEFGKPVQAAGLLTAAEAQLQNASAAEPNRRFHYRFVAAELANQAADLLPPRSQAFAAVLCKASGWLQYRDLAAAQGYYRRYVQEGPYVDWAENFGLNCQEPDFARAEQRRWQERQQAVRQALRPYKYGLLLGLLALPALAIYWRQRRRGLAIVDKTAEESRNE